MDEQSFILGMLIVLVFFLAFLRLFQWPDEWAREVMHLRSDIESNVAALRDWESVFLEREGLSVQASNLLGSCKRIGRLEIYSAPVSVLRGYQEETHRALSFFEKNR